MYGIKGKTQYAGNISTFSVVTPVFYFTFILKSGSKNLMVVFVFLCDFWK